MAKAKSVDTLEDGKEKAEKKWITCQISEEEHTNLEEYCKKYAISKTEVIRNFLQNIEEYAAIMKMLKKRLLQEVMKELQDKGVIEDEPETPPIEEVRKEDHFIPVEFTTSPIEADLSDIFQ